MESKETFAFTYSAAERAEINAIQRKYQKKRLAASSQDVTLEMLRNMDVSTMRPGVIWGLSLGIVGTLTVGGGMSMVMTGSQRMFWPGVLIGIIGIAIAAIAYPTYKKITAKRREQNAPLILELSEKLLDKEQEYSGQ